MAPLQLSDVGATSHAARVLEGAIRWRPYNKRNGLHEKALYTNRTLTPITL